MNTLAPLSAATAGMDLPRHRLRSISVIGGFLDGARIDLASGLNCLIGARGTGKTTVLELVRFALDALPSAEADPTARRRIESLVQKNLAGGRVELTIETQDGLIYMITRAAGEDPIVLNTNGEVTEITLKAGRFFGADVYSQNEVENIADQPASQLSLIDNFETERITAIASEIQTVQQALDASVGQIRPLQAKIASLTEELGALAGVEEKLKSYQTTGGQNAETINRGHAQKALRDRERRAVDELRQYLKEYAENLGTFSGVLADQAKSLFVGDVGTGANAAIIAAIRKTLTDCGTAVDSAISQARRQLDSALTEIAKASQALSVAHNQQELAFRALIERHQAAQSQAVERSRLERTRNELLSKRRTRDDLVQKLEAFQKQRSSLLERLSELRDERFAIRKAVAERITKALRGTVRASVLQAGDPSLYVDLLASSLRNSRIKQGVVAQKLVNSFMPVRLVEIIRSGDPRPLVEEGELNEDQARKVVEALQGSETLFKLEAVELNDLPTIELNDGGQYKPSPTLSTGQKCTTILPILLLESDKPLLIDQPEDNLDNRFVFECVVGSIRSAKAKRQLVFVTHNPNIPVLGDAERVFVLESDGTRARLVNQGTVDACKRDIVTLLEGGEEAFRLRQSRYAYANVA